MLFGWVGWWKRAIQGEHTALVVAMIIAIKATTRDLWLGVVPWHIHGYAPPARASPFLHLLSARAPAAFTPCSPGRRRTQQKVPGEWKCHQSLDQLTLSSNLTSQTLNLKYQPERDSISSQSATPGCPLFAAKNDARSAILKTKFRFYYVRYETS